MSGHVRKGDQRAGVLRCVGASNFGVEGIVEGAPGITDLTGTILATAGAAETAAVVLACFLPGILFPLTFLIVAAALIRAQEIPLWCGALLAAGALAFPLGRIPRIQEVALAADVLLLIPLLWLGSLYLRLWTADVTVRRIVDTGTGQ